MRVAVDIMTRSDIMRILNVKSEYSEKEMRRNYRLLAYTSITLISGVIGICLWKEKEKRCLRM